MPAAPEDTEAAAAAQSEPQQPGLKEQVTEALGSTRQIAADLIELFGLEARLASVSAAKLLGMGLAASFMLVSAWFLLQAAVAVWLSQLGLNLGITLLLFALVNAALTVMLIVFAIRNSRNLSFSATRKALSKGSSHEPAEADDRA